MANPTTKLEWKVIQSGHWESGEWVISVMVSGQFEAHQKRKAGQIFPAFADAIAWCEAQEAAKVSLPKVGEVWGVPDLSEVRRVSNCVSGEIQWWNLRGAGNWDNSGTWHSWLASSGAVRLDTMAARLAEAERLLRRWPVYDLRDAKLAEETRRFLDGGKATP